MSRRYIVPLATLALAASASAFAADAPKTAVTSQPDNSGVNKRDGAPATPTADDQSNDASALETTRSIRKAIVADDALSTYAHNVKIIAEGGQVFLRGPVKSLDEKRRVEELAKKAAGKTLVKSELEVSAN